MSRFFTSLGRFSVRFRYAIVILWLGITYISVAFLPGLSSVITNNNQDFLSKTAPSLQAARLANTFQNSNDSVVIAVAYRPSGVLTPADQRSIANLALDLRSVPTVIRSQVAGVAKDQMAEQISVISTTSQFSDSRLPPLIDAIRAKITSTPLPTDLQVHLAGQLATTVDTVKANGSNANSTQGFSVLIILIILLVIFRSVLAPFLTLLPALIVSIAAGPVVAWASKAIGFHVSFVTQLLLIVLVLGAGTDYGLFLVFRVREEMRKGLEPKAAVAYALSKVGESITFSGLTVAAALLSLVTATFGFYKGLGYPLAIAIALMLLAGLTLQPALLAIFGRAAFWPSRTKKGVAWVGAWGKIAGKVAQRPLITLVIGLTIFGSLAFASLGNKPSGFASPATSPAKSDSYYGNQALASHFPSSNFNPTQVIFKFKSPIWGSLDRIQALQNYLVSSKVYRNVEGPFNPLGNPLNPSQLLDLHERLGNPNLLPPIANPSLDIPTPIYDAYRSTAQFISSDGRTVLFATGLQAGNPSSTSALEAVPQLRAVANSAQSLFHAQASGVGGQAPAAYDIASSSSSDLFRIIPLVVVIIALLLGLVLRSVVAPLYLVVSVVLSYLAALGLDVIVFMKFRGDSGLTFILPFLLFVFLLALGEDYNILVMTRIREEAHNYPLKEAVKVAIGATGSTITSAGVVLAATFLVLGLAGSGGSAQVQEIGVGLALGILMDTFLVRSLLVPSTVVLLRHLNWWPSQLAQLKQPSHKSNKEILPEVAEI